MLFGSRLKVNIRNENVTVFLLAFATFLCGWAALSGDTTLSTLKFRIIMNYVMYFMVICIYVSILLRRYISFVPELFISILIFFLFEYLHVYKADSYSIGGVMVLLVLAVAFLSKNGIDLLFKYYKLIIVIMATVGIFCYLSYLLNLPIPFRMVEYYGASGFYIDYKVSYVLSSGVLIRLCGLFNEPGYFGTIIALILCVDKINLRKKENIILFIAGILTYSIAFLVIITVFFIFQSCKNIKIAIILCVFVIFIPIFLQQYSVIDMGSSNLSYYFSRFFNLKEAMKDRAYSSLERMVTEWKKSEKLFVGYGSGYASGTGSSSYKIVLLRHGIVGFFIIYGALLIPIICKVKRNLSALIFLLCFIINIYQRPFVFTLPYYVILYGGIERLSENTKKERIGGM